MRYQGLLFWHVLGKSVKKPWTKTWVMWWFRPLLRFEIWAKLYRKKGNFFRKIWSEKNESSFWAIVWILMDKNPLLKPQNFLEVKSGPELGPKKTEKTTLDGACQLIPLKVLLVCLKILYALQSNHWSSYSSQKKVVMPSCTAHQLFHRLPHVIKWEVHNSGNTVTWIG